MTELPSPNLHTMADRRIFADSTRAEADGYFQLGILTWISGANTGQRSDVKSFASGLFVLEQPTQYPIAFGDVYNVTPGCDLSIATCDTKFANSINFGGFPHLRGTDDLNRTPEAKAPK